MTPMFSTTEGFYDAEHNYCSPGSSFVDYAGICRQAGEGFVDASGAYVPPGSSGFIDCSGAFRFFGDPYVDSSGRSIASADRSFPSFSGGSWLGGVGNMSWVGGAFDAASGRGGGNWVGGMHQWMFSLMAVGVRLGVYACVIALKVFLFMARAAFWSIKVLSVARRRRISNRGAQYWSGLPSFPIDPDTAAKYPVRQDAPVDTGSRGGQNLNVVWAVFVLVIVSAIAFVLFVLPISAGLFASATPRPGRQNVAMPASPGTANSQSASQAPYPTTGPNLEKPGLELPPKITTPSPVKSRGNPSVDLVGKQKEEHNARIGSRVGVRIPVNLRFRNLKDRSLVMRVTFVDGHDAIVKSTESKYRGTSGQLSISKSWTPSTEDFETGIFDVFVPYSAFDLSKNRMTRVYATLQVWDGEKMLLKSRPLGMQVQPAK